MDLVPQGDTHQFKIDDTNTLLHYTATVNGEPQEFPSDDPCYFQIKTEFENMRYVSHLHDHKDYALV